MNSKNSESLSRVDQNAEEVRVNLGPRSYPILITSHRLAESSSLLIDWITAREGRCQSALIVTDSHVANVHGDVVASSLRQAGLRVELAIQPAGEQAKSLEHVHKLYDRLIEMQADRKTAVIAVGGGVVGDAAGFVAATYSRGVPFLQVPTTLLAAVDSSVGGKVGVNHPLAKNMIGAFHQPHGVLIDTATLKTLPDRDYRSGLAEVVKYGVILDEPFFEFLESRIAQLNGRDPETLRMMISRSCRLKADVVEQDEFERTGLRAILNYGHTFAHAFEALAGYGELLHGEAVSLGMVCASRLAERRGLIHASLTNRQEQLLAALQLPVRLPEGTRFPDSDVLARMRLDKKTVAGNLRFVLPTRMGHVDTFGDIPETDVQAVLATI